MKQYDKAPVVTVNIGGLWAILFVTLKLCHVIDWPWLWVLCPIWIPIVIFLIFILVIFLIWFKREW